MAENKDTNDDQRDSEEQSGRMQANTIWGTGFVRISLYILLGFILLATSRYVYLKVTEQSIIQYPHLEQMNSNTDSKKNKADQSETEEPNSSKNEQNEGAGKDSISQNGGRR